MEPGHYTIQHDKFRAALWLDDGALVLYPKAPDLPARWVARDKLDDVPADVRNALEDGKPTGEAMPSEWEITQIKSASKNHYR